MFDCGPSQLLSCGHHRPRTLPRCRHLRKAIKPSPQSSRWLQPELGRLGDGSFGHLDQGRTVFDCHDNALFNIDQAAFSEPPKYPTHGLDREA